MASLYDRVDDDSMALYLEKAVAASDPENEDHARIRSIAMRRLAPLMAERGQVDSAVAYFEIIAEEARAANDTVKLHSAETQAARVLFEAEQYPSALVMFRRIESRRPDDPMVKRNIATVFQAMGQMDSAQAVMASAGGGAVATIDTNSADFLINRGANRYSEQDYDGAIVDWQKASEVLPSSRLALINLGLAYNAKRDGANLVKVAKRSLEREPLHEFSHKLLLQGYIYQENGDAARAADAEIQGLPLNVDSLIVSSGPGGITINGKAMARDRPSPEMSLRFEFLGPAGEVKATEAVALPALVAGTAHQFTVTGAGSDIVNWRYRKE